jgi:hypothetical protein
MLTTAFQAPNASSRWYRIVNAERLRSGTEKQFRMAEWIDTNRCKLPGIDNLASPFPASGTVCGCFRRDCSILCETDVPRSAQSFAYRHARTDAFNLWTNYTAEMVA